MSAILSADDLNDFINPGVACIKPVEKLPPPPPPPRDHGQPYEVTTEDQVDGGTVAAPAQISLTDCLACSGCVTSAEAVLVSLQSHGEVLDALDRYHERTIAGVEAQDDGRHEPGGGEGRIFVASVSPQVRASLAATYSTSEREAGHMISQLLSGPLGVRGGGKNGSGFAWVVDTNCMREAHLVAAADEVQQALLRLPDRPTAPVIASVCPGWVCYAEKTHAHVLPHLSQLKSPQALTGVLLKSVLARRFGVPPQHVWHLAVMPCFDKKLEASRGELTSHSWHGQQGAAVRDVDCVITARELLMLAEQRHINFPALPKRPVAGLPAFPDPVVDEFLLGRARGQKRKREDGTAIGTSGGYLWHILKTQQARHPGSHITSQPGRNHDVSDYTVVTAEGEPVFKAARYYGFRNIQNLVRKLKPAPASRMPGATGRRKAGAARRPGAASAGGDPNDYAYVEVMACPGGCTNGGGQIKVGDVAPLRHAAATAAGSEPAGRQQATPPHPREWLAHVDEAYWSAESGSESAHSDHSPPPDSRPSAAADARSAVVDGIDHRRVTACLRHWEHVTGLGLDLLLKTTYRSVESDVGKEKGGGGGGGDFDRRSALAHAAGGGAW